MVYLTKIGRTNWNPFAELDNFLRDFGAGWLERAHPPAQDRGHGGGEFLLHVDENEQEYVIEALVPGFEIEDLKVVVENNVLSIAADEPVPESDGEADDAGGRARRWYARSFRRAYRLPTEVDADKIGAELKNGVLTVRVPKAEAAKPRAIEVQGA